ncbi:MAG: hypothetical protein JWO78_202 [Micavibrio sp.]|nr:hypothetical protein [Micavibrio sp.]
MKIKAVLDSIEGVDENLRGFYTEKDGKFVLSIEGVQEHPDTKALKSALDRVREEKKTQTTEFDNLKARFADVPAEFDSEEYHRLKDSAGSNVNIEQRLAEQRERLTKAHNTEKEKIAGERDQARKVLTSTQRDRAIADAIADAGIAPQFVDAVKAMFRDKVTVTMEGDDAIATIESMPVVDHLKTWAATEKGAHYVAAAQNSGGDANGGKKAAGGGKNPWAKDTFNLTEQMRIEKANPKQAEQLKTAAGAK